MLLLVGVILQNVLSDVSTADNAFRWLYFFAAWPLLFYALGYGTRKAFELLEVGREGLVGERGLGEGVWGKGFGGRGLGERREGRRGRRGRGNACVCIGVDVYASALGRRDC